VFRGGGVGRLLVGLCCGVCGFCVGVCGCVWLGVGGGGTLGQVTRAGPPCWTTSAVFKSNHGFSAHQIVRVLPAAERSHGRRKGSPRSAPSQSVTGLTPTNWNPPVFVRNYLVSGLFSGQ